MRAHLQNTPEKNARTSLFPRSGKLGMLILIVESIARDPIRSNEQTFFRSKKGTSYSSALVMHSVCSSLSFLLSSVTCVRSSFNWAPQKTLAFVFCMFVYHLQNLPNVDNICQNVGKFRPFSAVLGPGFCNYVRILQQDQLDHFVGVQIESWSYICFATARC